MIQWSRVNYSEGEGRGGGGGGRRGGGCLV